MLRQQLWNLLLILFTPVCCLLPHQLVTQARALKQFSQQQQQQAGSFRPVLSKMFSRERSHLEDQDDWALNHVLLPPPRGLPFEIDSVDDPSSLDELCKVFDEHDGVILLLPSSVTAAGLAAFEQDGLFPFSNLLKNRYRRRSLQKDHSSSACLSSGVFLTTELPDEKGTQAVLAAVEDKTPTSTLSLLRLAGDAIAAARIGSGANSAHCDESENVDDRGNDLSSSSPSASNLSLCVVVVDKIAESGRRRRFHPKLVARLRDSFIAAANAAAEEGSNFPHWSPPTPPKGSRQQTSLNWRGPTLRKLTLASMPEEAAGCCLKRFRGGRYSGSGFPIGPSVSRSVASATGETLTRWLTAAPPNLLTPKAFRALLSKVARDHALSDESPTTSPTAGVATSSLDCFELDYAALVEAGCGCFAAVAQGSSSGSASGEEEDGGGGAALVKLVWRPQTSPQAEARKKKVVDVLSSGDQKQQQQQQQRQQRQQQNNKKRRRAPLVLVGKGVTFDSGGVNVKTGPHMRGMKLDMAGAAAAVSALVALAQLGEKGELPAHLQGRNIECWVGITENSIGPKAMKPDDVVQACDGTTVELVHTDAEGRLVLADVLALASRKRVLNPSAWAKRTGSTNHKGGQREEVAAEAENDSGDSCGVGEDAAGDHGLAPALVIDLATLTGGCISALSKRYAGVFSNRFGDGDHGLLDEYDGGGGGASEGSSSSSSSNEGGGGRGRSRTGRDAAAAMAAVVRVGEVSGERLWPFPLDDDFGSTLKQPSVSGVDTLQCLQSGEADHLYAAAFLQGFVNPGVPWLHVDLAGPSVMPGGNGAHVRRSGSGDGLGSATGFGVRAVLEAVLDASSWAALARPEEEEEEGG